MVEKQHYCFREGGINCFDVPPSKIKYLISTLSTLFSGKPNEVCIWGEVQHYPLQTCVKNLKTEEDRKSNLTIDEIFEKDCHVFILNKAHYGQIGSVVKVTEGGSILVNIKNETDILKISYDAAKSQTKWLQGWKMANHLGLTSYILSRMTGTLYLHGPGTNYYVTIAY